MLASSVSQAIAAYTAPTTEAPSPAPELHTGSRARTKSLLRASPSAGSTRFFAPREGAAADDPELGAKPVAKCLARFSCEPACLQYLFLPTGRFVHAWAWVLVGLLVWTAVITPFQARGRVCARACQADRLSVSPGAYR